MRGGRGDRVTEAAPLTAWSTPQAVLPKLNLGHTMHDHTTTTYDMPKHDKHSPQKKATPTKNNIGALQHDSRSRQNKTALTKIKCTPLSLKLLAALCVLNRVGAATVPPVTTFDFDFSDGIAASPGWLTGGGDPTTHAFRKREGRTSSSNTGPSAGVGGSGSYVYAETSSPRVQGDLFTLAYDGSACSDIGLGVRTVAFSYHMYGATMGELRVTNAAGKAVWSLGEDVSA